MQKLTKRQQLTFLILLMSIFSITHQASANQIILTGTGTVSTNYFYLTKGLYVFDIKTSTTKLYESFNFKLLDSNGNTISYLASFNYDHPDSNTISTTVNIGYDGNFIVSSNTSSDIDGPWEVTIKSPSDIQIINLSDSGYSFSGTGTKVTDIFTLNKGLYVFNFKVSMPDINAVGFKLLDSYGNTIDYGEYISADYSTGEISKPIIIAYTGNYLISFFTFSDITGDWELKILTPKAMTYYTKEYVDQAVSGAVIQERTRWDFNGDNKIGIEEAIRALQIVSGMR